MKRVIILGGGKSMREGIAQGLWDKIKEQDLWSLNSIFITMPYLPTRELWVDKDFFRENTDRLQKLWEQGVKVVARNHQIYVNLNKMIKLYPTTREKQHYYGKEAIKKNIIYYGRMGLTGFFALSLAIAEGYDEIFLLGYDFGSASLQEKDTHVYQNDIVKEKIYSLGAGHPEVYLMPDNTVRREVEDFKVFLQEDNIKIWNVSPNSNIPYFERISYESFFQKLST